MVFSEERLPAPRSAYLCAAWPSRRRAGAPGVGRAAGCRPRAGVPHITAEGRGDIGPQTSNLTEQRVALCCRDWDTEDTQTPKRRQGCFVETL